MHCVPSPLSCTTSNKRNLYVPQRFPFIPLLTSTSIVSYLLYSAKTLQQRSHYDTRKVSFIASLASTSVISCSLYHAQYNKKQRMQHERTSQVHCRRVSILMLESQHHFHDPTTQHISRRSKAGPSNSKTQTKCATQRFRSTPANTPPRPFATAQTQRPLPTWAAAEE